MKSSDSGPGTQFRVKRLVIVADSSLVVEAMCVGFRRSPEFNLVGHADGHRTSARTVVGPAPDAILIDDMHRSERAIELTAEIRAVDGAVALIVLSAKLDHEWLERIFDAGATAAISSATHPLALATLVRETLNGRIVHRLSRPSAVGTRIASAPSCEHLSLTRRELEILQLVASGATNGDMARRLWVTEQTVKFHLRNIYRKLDVTNRTEASHFAHINGLLSAGPAAA